MINKVLKPSALILIIYAIPVLATLLFIYSFGVDVPYMDSFVLVELFHKIYLKTVTFQDFWMHHNEHRILIPRFLIASLAFLTSWNVKIQQYFSVGLTAISALGLCWLGQQTQHQKNTWIHFANLVTVILIFSLVQYENWLWGFQLTWFWITTCLVMSLVFLWNPPQRSKLDRGYLLSLVFAILSSFSSAHGLIVWIVVYPLVWVRSRSSKKFILERAIWRAFFVISVLVYASDYNDPPGLIDRTYVLKHPGEAILFFLTVLGRSLAIQPSSANLVGLVIFVLSTLVIFIFLRDTKHQEMLAPWLALLLFSLSFAGLTSVGRTILGINMALASRYTTVTILILIALIQIARIYSESQARRILYAGFAVLIAISSIYTSIEAIKFGKNSYQNRSLGKACFSLIEYMEESHSSCIYNIFIHFDSMKNQYYPKLRQIGFFDFVQGMEFSSTSSASYGVIDAPSYTEVVQLKPDSTFVISGWSILPDHQDVPEMVLFSKNKSLNFFAATWVNKDSPDLVDAFNNPNYDKARWEIHLPSINFSSGITEIQAWVYDGDSNQFHRLSNSIKVQL